MGSSFECAGRSLPYRKQNRRRITHEAERRTASEDATGGAGRYLLRRQVEENVASEYHVQEGGAARGRGRRRSSFLGSFLVEDRCR